MPSASLPRRSVGLRGRVVLSFALGALLLSLALVLSVYTISRGYMESQRERSAERQTATHADYVRSLLDNPDVAAESVLPVLDPPTDTVLLLRVGQRWFSSAPDVSAAALPDTLRDGAVGPERMTLRGAPYLAVGVPVTDAGTMLYGLTPLHELESTLQILRVVLGTSGLVTTLAGVVLGLWASRRVLAPLHRLAGTAARIAGGELDTRLGPDRDRDLHTIVESFNAMVDSLQRRIDRERRFFADVSHELRTPLTTLVTSVGVMARYEHELPDRSRRALALVTAELEHLRRLLDDLLALARSEAGLHQDPMEPMSVGELLTHTLTDSRRPVVLLTVASDATVNGRKSSLERALLNLMDNADRHGGGLSGVRVTATPETARIVIDDAGPGVPVDSRERIFERFATAAAGRRSPDGSGTGLGLALVAETVHAHGGTIRCTEKPGGGARFVLTQPTTSPYRVGGR